MHGNRDSIVVAAGHSVTFESYGVGILIESNDAEIFEKLLVLAAKALLGNVRLNSAEPARQVFTVDRVDDGTFSLARDGELLTEGSSFDAVAELFIRLLRLRISEFAKDFVFVHAGVVSWKGKAIVIPANSGCGKTSLVVELVKLGAEYYSDEYAVLDSKGYVHPFARDLSVRSEGRLWSEKDGIPVENFGGKAGEEPIPVGMVILTEFKPDAVWQPDELTVGQGILETISHTIPFRVNTEFSLMY
ncbi:MAG: hypothetical protein QUS14_09560 [Pyrinomonadaceae bacterium]|nr:hypothetical protein [Pyrinomonadaceae bacterium]